MSNDGDLDLAQAARRIVDLASRDIDVADAMRELIDWCSSHQPCDDWKRFRDLDFMAELGRLGTWLDDVLSAEPPKASVTGIYFGLFNPQYDDDEGPVADIYVAGGIYGDDDWLSAVSQHWWANGRYARSQLLAQIYRIAYESPSSLGNNAEYPLVLGFGVFAAKHLCLSIKPRLLGGGGGSRWITVGFESGDVLTLGQLSASGLALSLTW
jgi:hypothetical protein